MAIIYLFIITPLTTARLGAYNLKMVGHAVVREDAAKDVTIVTVVPNTIFTSFDILRDLPRNGYLTRAENHRHPLPLELCLPIGIGGDWQPHLVDTQPLDRQKRAFGHQIVAWVARNKYCSDDIPRLGQFLRLFDAIPEILPPYWSIVENRCYERNESLLSQIDRLWTRLHVLFENGSCYEFLVLFQ